MGSSDSERTSRRASFYEKPGRAQRESVLVDFRPVASSTVGALAGTFDIILDFTPGL